ncbi:heterokaryon incompatibility protein-domain-containing protein, partial [Calycina marina]
IRLLTLASERSDDPLHGRLLPTFLHDGQSNYRDISYCWGEPVLSSHINTEGTEYRNTLSLSNALKRFRGEGDMVFLWCDSLCINQVDIEEHNWQVTMMADVYEQVSSVVIWLGEACKWMKLLKCLSNVPTENLATDLKRFCADPLASFRGGEDIVNALRRFLGAPYFQRLWLFQELALGRNIIF